MTNDKRSWLLHLNLYDVKYNSCEEQQLRLTWVKKWYNNVLINEKLKHLPVKWRARHKLGSVVGGDEIQRAFINPLAALPRAETCADTQLSMYAPICFHNDQLIDALCERARHPSNQHGGGSANVKILLISIIATTYTISRHNYTILPFFVHT